MRAIEVVNAEVTQAVVDAYNTATGDNLALADAHPFTLAFIADDMPGGMQDMMGSLQELNTRLPALLTTMSSITGVDGVVQDTAPEHQTIIDQQAALSALYTAPPIRRAVENALAHTGSDGGQSGLDRLNETAGTALTETTAVGWLTYMLAQESFQAKLAASRLYKLTMSNLFHELEMVRRAAPAGSAIADGITAAQAAIYADFLKPLEV